MYMYITNDRVFGGTPSILIFWLFLNNLSISEQTIDRALINNSHRTNKIMIQWRKIISFDFHHIPKLSIGFKSTVALLLYQSGGKWYMYTVHQFLFVWFCDCRLSTCMCCWHWTLHYRIPGSFLPLWRSFIFYSTCMQCMSSVWRAILQSLQWRYKLVLGLYP